MMITFDRCQFSLNSFNQNIFIDLDDTDIACTPRGGKYKKDCNVCLCQKNGAYFCTKQECSTQAVRMNIENEAAPRNCTSDEEFIEDCNKCTCDSSLLLQCTSVTCPVDSLTIFGIVEIDPFETRIDSTPDVTIEELLNDNFKCVPLKPFKVECNTCWCAKNGKEPRHCTRVACNPKTYPPLND